MWTGQQLDFFRTFGYLTVSIDMFADVMPELHAESARALTDAYPVDPGGTLLLPAMSEFTRCSVALVDDERIVTLARSLLEANVVVKPPKITRFGKATNWHRDCYMGLRGVKACVYFSDDPKQMVAFDLVPASHCSVVRDYLDRLFNRKRLPEGAARNPNRVLPPQVPKHTLQLLPGQMLFFDLGLWHANLMDEKRLQWGITYLPAPEDDEARATVVDHLAEFFEYEQDFPRARYPYFPCAWETREADSPIMETMHSSGVMGLYSRRYGLRSDGTGTGTVNRSPEGTTTAIEDSI